MKIDYYITPEDIREIRTPMDFYNLICDEYQLNKFHDEPKNRNMYLNWIISCFNTVNRLDLTSKFDYETAITVVHEVRNLIIGHADLAQLLHDLDIGGGIEGYIE